MVCRGEGHHATVLGRCEAASHDVSSPFAFCQPHVSCCMDVSYQAIQSLPQEDCVQIVLWLCLTLALCFSQAVSICEAPSTQF